MGHERIGFLPKTKKWRDIVDNISTFKDDEKIVSVLANQVLKNVRKKFENLHTDKGVQAAFQFLVLLSYSTKLKNPKEFLSEKGIILENDYSLLQVTKQLTEWTYQNIDSNEYGTLAIESAINCITTYYENNIDRNENLFGNTKSVLEIWNSASDGGGFSEISRLYFSNFTEKYLKYFIDREASAKIENIESRNELSSKLEEYINDISKHAFETSKITQSFAAGWYNKNSRNTEPDIKKIKGFLSIAFGKMKSELLKEEKGI